MKWLEFVHKKDAIRNFYEKWDTYKIQCFLHICKNILTPIQYKKCTKYNDYADFAVAGKKLNKFLDDYWKKNIIELIKEPEPYLDIDINYINFIKGEEISYTYKISLDNIKKIISIINPVNNNQSTDNQIII